MESLNGFKIEKFNQYNLQESAKQSTCPLCSASRKKSKDKCLSLNWNTGLGKCHHCGEVIQLHTYKKKEEDVVYSKPIWKNNTELSENVVKWFEGRKISQFTLRKLQISEGVEWMPQTQKDENTIQFNYFRENELINIKFRDARKHFKLSKNAQKIFYNLDNIRTEKEAIIVEGEIDVLSYVEASLWNCVSVPNGSTISGTVNLDYLDSCYDYFENKNKVYLALDSDEAGQHVTKELIRRLGAEKCFLVDFEDCKDANEYLIKHGKEKLRETISNAKPCPLENIQLFQDIKHDLHDFYINGSKKGFTIGLDNFDNIFSTYTSQYVVVTGIPSSGKSDFVDQMTVGYNLNYNWKIAYASPENKPSYLHVDKIARKFSGFRPNSVEDLQSTGWQNVESHIQDNFFFMDFENGYSLEKVLAKGAELVKRKGIKCLVLDPFNKIQLKSSNKNDINQYTNDYLNMIDDFCKKYDVFVILVAHPVKMRKQIGDKSIPEPTFYDIKGGGEFYDMSYHGLLVHRNYDNDTVKVKVLKVKFSNLGDNQSECFFMWNKNNGRYSYFEGDPEEIESILTPSWDNTNWLDKDEQQKKEYEKIVNSDDWITSNTDFDEEAPF